MKANKIIENISEAFLGLSYPGDDDLTVHPLGLDEDFFYGLRKRKWNDLESDFLNYHHDCIGVLTPKGFQYFIAAFLQEGLSNESPIAGAMIWEFSEAIIENSSPIKGVSGKNWFNERLNALNEIQRTSLINYFSYLKHIDEDEESWVRIDFIVAAINEI